MRRSVCILWHCHQPCYRDALTGEVLLPWVRLHAARAYAEMPRRLLEEAPSRATFSLTPVLLDQLEACGRGAPDAWWTALARPAEELAPAERRLWAERLGSVQGRSAERWEGFRRLRERAASSGAADPAELRDLQVWFLLAWCGPSMLDEPWIAGLPSRGGGFTEEEKRDLMARLDARAAGAQSAFREAQEAGAAELASVPYYHPILPLLCDAAEGDPAPGVEPPLSFAEPADARIQVAEAFASHARRLGRPPAGFWPAEGAVSQASLDALASVPVRWIATDLSILHRSLAMEGRSATSADFLTPHRVETEQGGIAVFFRDTGLSDRIGFEYAQWPDAVRAAEDLVGRLDALPWGSAPAECVTLALDGENAWGYYADGGRPFLRALYRKLSAHPRLRMRTFSEHLEEVGGVRALPRLRAIGTGSWIHGSLGTWAAKPAQREAWSLLAEARKRCGPASRLDALHLAEGSDWLWWLGDHRTDQQDLFVGLFASAVRKGCRDAGTAEPEGLAPWAAALSRGKGEKP